MEYIPQGLNMSITHLKEGLVSGIILGDGSLNNFQYGIKFRHTLPQLAYLKFKLRLLEQVGFSCRLFRLTKERTSLGIFEYCTGTATGGDIYKYYNYSLENLLDNLNSLGLLIWWLDDGCLTVHQKQNGSISRFGYLNTQGFNLLENQIIQQALLKKFGIETSLHIDSQSGLAKQDHWRIYLNATNMRRLIDTVRDFISWCPINMRYKFNMQYVVNRRHNSLEMTNRYNF